MKQYDTGDLRNLAVVGHGASGKTTLVEAMLALGKEINRMGSIEAGTTVSLEIERQTGETIALDIERVKLNPLNKLSG